MRTISQEGESVFEPIALQSTITLVCGEAKEWTWNQQDKNAVDCYPVSGEGELKNYKITNDEFWWLMVKWQVSRNSGSLIEQLHIFISSITHKKLMCNEPPSGIAVILPLYDPLTIKLCLSILAAFGLS